MSRKRLNAQPAVDDATPRRRVIRLLAELVVAACRVGTVRQASPAKPRRTQGGAQ